MEVGIDEVVADLAKSRMPRKFSWAACRASVASTSADCIRASPTSITGIESASSWLVDERALLGGIGAAEGGLHVHRPDHAREARLGHVVLIRVALAS